jgi:hypothetical protein
MTLYKNHLDNILEGKALQLEGDVERIDPQDFFPEYQ